MIPKLPALHYAHRILSMVVVLALGWSALFWPSSSQAQESVTVSATVPTNNPPSVPILIAPDNNSYVNTNLVTFVWEGATDDIGVTEYELHLDGLLYFDAIPTTSTVTSEYTLVYDSSTNTYTLTINSPLSEGIHTWKIRAVDIQAAFTESVTWSFTIDTQAPNFVITQIGDATVSISAQDPSTLPLTPIELQNNEPLLAGTGEPNSTVNLTVIIPGDPTQNFTTTIGSDGTWSIQLGILPRDTIITLEFVITDLANNVTVLSGVQFIIRQEEIVFPQPSPSASPLVTIPFTPPREIVFNLLQETLEGLPAPLKALIASLPPELVETLRDLGPISTALVVAAVPVLTTAAIATQFGARFSLEILARVLQALGLIPSGKPRGFIFDSQTHKGVPFALLTITSVDLSSTPLIETVVSDVEGIYKGVELPLGKYQIDVRHQEYRFPSARPRPPYLTIRDFYRGEQFEINSEKDAELLFLIPMDAIETSGRRTWKNQVRVFLAYLSRFSAFLILPLFVVSGILTLLFPSFWNWVVFGIYTLVVIYKSVGWFKIPRLTGVVVDTHGNPIESAIVRIIISENSELAVVTSSNAEGRFTAFVEPAKYQLSVIKPGYVWTDAPVGSFYELDLTGEAQHLVATMEQVDQWVG